MDADDDGNGKEGKEGKDNRGFGEQKIIVKVCDGVYIGGEASIWDS